MNDLKDVAIPIFVAVISVALTALVTLKTKYAKSEEEAKEGLIRLGKQILYYCWMLWLIYGLVKLIASTEPITRVDIFSISLYVICIVMMAVFDLFNRVNKVIGRILYIQDMHSESIIRHGEMIKKATEAAKD